MTIFVGLNDTQAMIAWGGLMKSGKKYIIICGIPLSALMVFLYIHQNHSTKNPLTQLNNEANHPDQPPKPVSGEASKLSTSKNISSSLAVAPPNQSTIPDHEIAVKKDNNCFRFSYQHEAKNQNRDLEDFLNDTNAFPILNSNVNQKSICVKVNEKPVNHKFVKKDGKSEVIIGSVVGPDSTIQVSYCVGSAPCKEACAVKIKNKVDELLSESEMGGLENTELETQVKELRNVASVHGDLMDSTIIRNWNQLQTKEWVCEK